MLLSRRVMLRVPLALQRQNPTNKATVAWEASSDPEHHKGLPFWQLLAKQPFGEKGGAPAAEGIAHHTA